MNVLVKIPKSRRADLSDLVGKRNAGPVVGGGVEYPTGGLKVERATTVFNPGQEVIVAVALMVVGNSTTEDDCPLAPFGDLFAESVEDTPAHREEIAKLMRDASEKAREAAVAPPAEPNDVEAAIADAAAKEAEAKAKIEAEIAAKNAAKEAVPQAERLAAAGVGVAPQPAEPPVAPVEPVIPAEPAAVAPPPVE